MTDRALVEAAQYELVGRRASEMAVVLGRLKTVGLDGDFWALHLAVSHLMVEPVPEWDAAIQRLWTADAAALADVVSKRDDLLLSAQVCEVLGPDALKLACQVTAGRFPFTAVVVASDRTQGGYWDGDACRDAMQALLLDVSRTDAWRGWMRGLFQYIDTSFRFDVLAQIFAQLTRDKRLDFVQALALRYSRPDPMVTFMARVEAASGAEALDELCQLSFVVWNAWDYERSDKGFHLFDPAVSALDAAVIRYYAQMPEPDVDAVLASLRRDLDAVDMAWHRSLTDMGDELNRLRSRIRLVEHAKAQRQGEWAPLPPPLSPKPASASRLRHRPGGGV
ncbi:MAG: hypothetical protein E6R08_10075 [Nevskiaceae bacterium]|nr:MAG: hypothetical protein E6R08_10075 [Nevskiaceae bacterium]